MQKSPAGKFHDAHPINMALADLRRRPGLSEIWIKLSCISYIALSTTYQRALIALAAMALTSSCAGELYQDLA
jgi:hypothetical protein